MKKLVMVLALFAFVAASAVPVMAAQSCPQGIQYIYQYSVATSPYANHEPHFLALVSAATTRCANLYGNHPGYMGPSVRLNSTCTSFRVSCKVCGGGGLTAALDYPMSIDTASGIANGSTGGSAGVIVDIDLVSLERYENFVPGFVVEYASESGGLTVEIDAETGESAVVELYEEAPEE